MNFVVAFECILLSDIPEDCDGLIECFVDFLVRFLQRVICIYRATRISAALTPLRPFFKFSSMNNEMNSGERVLRLMNDSNA